MTDDQINTQDINRYHGNKIGNYSFTDLLNQLMTSTTDRCVYAIVCDVDHENFLLDVGESLK